MYRGGYGPPMGRDDSFYMQQGMHPRDQMMIPSKGRLPPGDGPDNFRPMIPSAIRPADPMFIAGREPFHGPDRMFYEPRGGGGFGHPGFPPVPPQMMPPMQNPMGPPRFAEFNEPRRRENGFDKTPDVNSSEDYRQFFNKRRDEPRENVMYEKVGGDMEISRSRSNTPPPSKRKPHSAKKSRFDDDRNRDRDRHSKRRSRSRSPREHRELYFPGVADDELREGIVWAYDNFSLFLNYWIGRLDDESKISNDRDIRGTRKLIENMTKASRVEKEKIVLPPEYKDRDRLLHCDLSIYGLPSAIFFGSGYGTRPTTARNAAAKDLIDKCHRIGVMSSELHAAISDRHKFERRAHEKEIRKATDAILLVRKKMASERLPRDVFSQRQLEPEVIDKFKMILRMVMAEVYYKDSGNQQTALAASRGQGSFVLNTQNPVPVPDPSKIQDAVPYAGPHVLNPQKVVPVPDPSRIQDPSPYAGYNDPRNLNRAQPVSPPNKELTGLTAIALIAKKEKQMRERMEAEMAARQKEMEEEIRRKVREEEREKIKEQLEREKRIEMMLLQHHQFQKEKDLKEQERALYETQQKELLSRMQKEVEDELNKMVVQLEMKLLEFRQKEMTAVLDMVFASSTFQKIASLAEKSNDMSVADKKQLVVDLRALLECASASSNSVTNRMPSAYSSMSNAYSQMANTTSGSHQNLAKPRDEVTRFTVGDLKLRSMTLYEQRRLTSGQKVIAQDMKTGKWQLATIIKIKDFKATLNVNNTTWKKKTDELFTEDEP